MNVSFCWSANTGVSMYKSTMDDIAYECTLIFQSSASLVCFSGIGFQMGDWWPRSNCFVICCFQELFKTALSLFEQFPSSFISVRFVKVKVVQPYNSSNTAH